MRGTTDAQTLTRDPGRPVVSSDFATFELDDEGAEARGSSPTDGWADEPHCPTGPERSGARIGQLITHKKLVQSTPLPTPDQISIAV